MCFPFSFSAHFAYSSILGLYLQPITRSACYFALLTFPNWFFVSSSINDNTQYTPQGVGRADEDALQGEAWRLGRLIDNAEGHFADAVWVLLLDLFHGTFNRSTRSTAHREYSPSHTQDKGGWGRGSWQLCGQFDDSCETARNLLCCNLFNFK